jgi:hypothetical protein
MENAAFAWRTPGTDMASKVYPSFIFVECEQY